MFLKLKKNNECKKFKNTLFLVSFFLLNACGGEDRNVGNSSETNSLPIASAGAVVEIKEMTEVVLNGSGSSDSDGRIVAYQWSQVDNGAPIVSIIDADAVQSTFQAPDISADTNFEFQLVVTDDDEESSVDSVSIIVFNTLPDWETHQANSSHTGYVPAKTYTKEFRKLWEWERPNKDAGVTPYINPVVTSNGNIYVTEDDFHQPQKLYALNENSGEVIWSYDFGIVAQLNQPAINNNVLSVTTSGHDDTFFWNFDAETGTVLSKTPFSVQWPRYLSPTVFNGVAYINSGYYGGRTSAFSTVDGTLLWESDSYGDNDMFTPAVIEGSVYHYSGNGLCVLNSLDGSLAFDIIDPDPDATGYSHIGSTVIGSMNNIISFSGDNFSGQASSSTEGYDDRRLVCFDLTSRSVLWKTISYYLTHPAVSDGQVFAATNYPLRLEVLNEYDGTVLWTWVPQDSSVTSFHRNIVVTEDLIFVSSNTAVHAISRETHDEVWSYPEPGALTISGNKNLYIATGYRQSEGKLVAISLKLTGQSLFDP